MESKTETHQVRVNNTDIDVETALGNPQASPKQLLRASDNHPGSYALFFDAYEDADDAPALLEERCGERVDVDTTVDVEAHQRFVARLKRHL